MSFKKDLSYRDIPFSSETPQEDFFLYDTIRNLHAECESNKNKIIKIRTVGILRNKHGRFYIKEISASHFPSYLPGTRQSIQVSLVYMNRSVRCSNMQHPVQLFGRLQWCNSPVIFAQILQPLSVSVATLLLETMARVSSLKFSNSCDSHELENQINQICEVDDKAKNMS